MNSEFPKADLRQRVEGVLGEYLVRVDKGEQIDQEEFICQHPEIADELRAYFADRQAVEQMLSQPEQDTDARSEGTSVLDPGSLGNYVILRRIGQGGMGQVYKARHERMKRVVALKILPKEVADSPVAIRRFQREVEVAARLSHPNIVTAYDADEIGGMYFLVMEYVEGSDLARLVREQGPLPTPDVVDYVIQVARGLEYAHARGVIHRDIKPSNLLLDQQGTVKVLDMGLARIHRDTDAPLDASGLTQIGIVMGTLDYMSPEQADDTSRADVRSDVYSLGCTLYYLLADRPVYQRDTAAAKIMGHREDPIPSLTSLAPDVPGRLDSVFQQMVAKSPEERYQSMSDLIAELEPCRDLLAQSSGAEQEHRTLASQNAETRERRETVKPNTVPTARPSSWKRTAAACLVGICMIGLFFGVIFRFQTDGGLLIVEVNEPDARVDVDDGKITVATADGGESLELEVEPGKHMIRVAKDGFETFTEEFVVRSGNRDVIKVRLVPARTVPKIAETTPAEFGPDGGMLHATTRWNDLLPIVDPQRDAVLGEWQSRNGQLLLAGTFEYSKRIEIPVIPRGSYDVSVDFTRLANDGEVALILPVQSESVVLMLRGPNQGRSALGHVQQDFKAGCEARQPTLLSNGRSHTVLATVRLSNDRAEIRVSFDGEPLINWQGPQSALSPWERYALPRRDTLGIGGQAPMAFHAVRLRMLDGTAQRYTPPEDEWVNLVKTIQARGGSVEIDDEGRIVACNLRGAIVRITDREMSQLANLHNLGTLCLAANWAISDAGMAHLAEMDHLRELDLSFTYVGDAGLEQISRLQNLERLELHCTLVSDAGLQFLRPLQSLRRLSAGWTRITDEGLAHLAELKGLKELELIFLTVGDPGAEHLARLTNLESLELEGAARLTDQGLDHLTSLKKIRNLRLCGAGITGDGLANLRSFPDLEVLSLSRCRRLKDDDLLHLADLKLVELWLEDMSITSAGVAHLRSLQQLRDLRLSKTQVDDTAVKDLVELKELRHIDVTDTAVSAAGLAELRAALPTCQIGIAATIAAELQPDGTP